MKVKPSVSGPCVGPSNWGPLSLDGWRWFANVPVFTKHDEREFSYFDEETDLADLRLEAAISAFGRWNVLTGNAWRNHGPFGRPGQVGIYVKKGKS